MEQTMSATWAEFLAGAAGFAIIIVGGVWAVISVFLSDLKRDYRVMHTQMDGVQIAVNSLDAAVAELKASMAPIADGQNEMRTDLDKLRSEVDAMSGHVASITKFLGQLAGRPPSFPPDLPE